ncbi:Small ribosomal subunit protein eS27w [Orobanche minor]
MVLPNDIDMLHPPPELKARKHRLKRLDGFYGSFREPFI